MPRGGARKGAGRKPLGPIPMVRLSILLPPELAVWVKAWPEGASAFVRALIELERRRTGLPDQAPE